MTLDIRRFSLLLTMVTLLFSPGAAQALGRTHLYSFSVADQTNHPVAGAHVYTRGVSGYDQKSGECTTAQDGTCSIKFTAFMPTNSGIIAAIEAGCDGHAETKRLAIESSMFKNEDTLSTSVTLMKGSTILLSVKDEAGLPVADAQARISSVVNSHVDNLPELFPSCSTNSAGQCSVCMNFAGNGGSVQGTAVKAGFIAAESAGVQPSALELTLYRKVRTLPRLTVVDVKRKPIAGAVINARIQPTKADVSCVTGASGTCPNEFQFEASNMNYSVDVDVRAEGMYDKAVPFTEHIGSQRSAFEIVLMKPEDYLCRDLTAPKLTALGTQMVLSVDLLRKIAALKDAEIDYGAICVSTFKGKKYFSIPMAQHVKYNKLKLNNDQIGTIVFDELVRKVLDVAKLYDKLPLDGFDITIRAQAGDAVENYRNAASQDYRFYFPKHAIEKYKDKDITSQQLIDASVVLLNDDRIDLRLH